MDRYDSREQDGRDTPTSAGLEWGRRAGRDADHTRDGNFRGPFTRHLDLPRGDARERIRGRDRDYDLNAADSEAFATIGGVPRRAS
jgi:hypothetical protein